MREVDVAAAIIFRERRVLAAQRPAGDRQAGCWEFPGGKIEAGETAEMCLLRELREELGIEVHVRERFCSVSWDYVHARVHLHTFFCDLVGGEPAATEHQALRWLAEEELASVQWSAADQLIVMRLQLERRWE